MRIATMASSFALPALLLASMFPQAAHEKPAPPRGVHTIAVVRTSVPLRARPNGRVVARVGARTEFGGLRALSVAARRGPWLGVVATELPNGGLAWVNRRNQGLRLRRTAYSLHAQLSGRWLELRKNGVRVRRLTVAIGRPSSETPTGRFAVTDKLAGSRYGSYYGCCILALSGHQPNLPAGWPGGDRLAIHGTDAPGTIGAAASAGCLRAADADLQVLMQRVPLGTPVFIRN
jgi:L,D-transpeptidase catalytic domain